MIKDRIKMNGFDEDLIKYLTNTVIKIRNENRINTIDSSNLHSEPIQFVLSLIHILTLPTIYSV